MYNPNLSPGMRPFKLGIVIALLTAGCTSPSTPEAAFNRLAEAAQSGDRAAFLDGLTQDSQELMKAMLVINGVHSTTMRVGPFESVSKALRSEVKDNLAIVTVATIDSENGQARVVMSHEDGRWRLNLPGTEALWNLDWRQSGGKLQQWKLDNNPEDDPGEMR
jgi:hypothetical protein